MKRRVRVKPSRGQSLLGGIVGVIFCFIGIGASVAGMGAFGVLWTLLALTITIMNFYNAFSDKGIATHEIAVDDCEDEKIITATPQKTTEQRLETIKKLYESGDITYAEYEEKRKQIINEI